MPNKVLDQPINSSFAKIRKSYFSILEFIILSANAIFTLLGLFICGFAGFTEENWMFLLTPTALFLLFGTFPFHFVYKWRKASLLYDSTQDTSLLEDLTNHPATLLIRLLLVFWLLLFFIFSDFLTNTSSFMTIYTQSYSTLLIRLLAYCAVIILGPLQFFFIRNVNKMNKKLILQHK